MRSFIPGLTFLYIFLTFTPQALALPSPPVPGSHSEHLFCDHATASKPSSSVSSYTSMAFTSLSAAVTHAANSYNPLSIEEDREYMGVILQNRNKPADYTYTVEAGKAGKDKITINFKLPSTYKLVAFWHTHGAAHHKHKYFSRYDTALANRWDIPFYLADHTGILKVFRPGGRTLSPMQARRLQLGFDRGYSKGEKVVDSNTGKVVKVNTIHSQVKPTSSPLFSYTTNLCSDILEKTI